MTIIRRRTYTAGTVALLYGYYMTNSIGHNDYECNIYYDQDNNYYNPVFKKYGCEERSGYFPLAKMDHSIPTTARSNLSNTNVSTYDILQCSYTDGLYIACLNGTSMYWSSNGGSSWSNALFTLSYGRTGANHIMDALFVYFDSTYIYVLFEVSSAATVTATSSVSLWIAYYPRAGGTVSYRNIKHNGNSSYNDHYLNNERGPGTRMSPNGVVCCSFTYKKSGPSMMLTSPFPNEPSINKITCALMYIPGLISSDNSYKYFDIAVDNSGQNTSYSYGMSYVNNIPKWHWDSGYGYFLLPIIVAYYTGSGSTYASSKKIAKIPISISGTTLSSPTVSAVYSSNTSNWNTDYMLIAEHSQGIVSDETLLMEPSKTLKIMNVSTWTTKMELDTMANMLSLQGTTLPFYGGSTLYYGINITPDGTYYVIFSSPGVALFINRRNGKVLRSTKFLGTGNTVNTVYHRYMMPKRIL